MQYDFIQDGFPYVILDEVYYKTKKITKPVPATTPIPLPYKERFVGDDLVVCLNTKSLTPLIHYNYCGDAGDYWGIWLNFDLYKGDIITFRKTTKS
jgi:hypothetical protein